jgi:hypothetical protein
MADPSNAPHHHARWTQTDITMLRERVGAGASIDDLASLLGRSASDVAHMMDRLRLVPTGASPSAYRSIR